MKVVMKQVEYLKKSFKVLGLFLFSQIGAGLFGVMKESSLEKGETSLSILANIFIIVAVVLSIWGSIAIGKTINVSKFNLDFLTLKNLLIIFGSFFLTRIITIFLMCLLTIQGDNMTANDAAIEIMFSNESPLLIILIMAISASIIEEIVFRGGIIGYLFIGHEKIGILISSILFGLIHGPTNLVSFILYTSIGLILALAYYKSKRLEVSIVIHFLNNLLATLSIIFGIG